MGKYYSYEYNINEIGFKILHETAILCSEAVFDNSLP